MLCFKEDLLFYFGIIYYIIIIISYRKIVEETSHKMLVCLAIRSLFGNRNHLRCLISCYKTLHILFLSHVRVGEAQRPVLLPYWTGISPLSSHKPAIASGSAARENFLHRAHRVYPGFGTGLVSWLLDNFPSLPSLPSQIQAGRVKPWVLSLVFLLRFSVQSEADGKPGNLGLHHQERGKEHRHLRAAACIWTDSRGGLVSLWSPPNPQLSAATVQAPLQKSRFDAQNSPIVCFFKVYAI